MDASNYVAPRASLNASIDAGLALVAQIAKDGSFGLVALFAERIGGAQAGSYMVPYAEGQNNGTAPWVDTSTDLTTEGINVTTPIYMQVWIDKLGYYCDVAGVAADLKRGETLKQALA